MENCRHLLGIEGFESRSAPSHVEVARTASTKVQKKYSPASLWRRCMFARNNDCHVAQMSPVKQAS
jgi:hypothetical protein